jgi:hypothetical protein
MSSSSVIVGSLNRTTAEMVSISTSRSSVANEARARKLLLPNARARGMEDPAHVSVDSSNLVLNLLYSYIGIDEVSGMKPLLSKDSMAAMMQGMQMVYDRAGHTSNWHVGPDRTASGNPLRGNLDMARLRKKHRAKLAEAGRTSKRATPITEEHVCRNYRLLLLDGLAQQNDKRLWALHAAWVVGLHCGLRFDELSKLQATAVSFGQNIRITLPLRTKNSIDHKEYILDSWFCPLLDESHAMDPVMALCHWLTIRGTGAGHIFCSISASGRLDYTKPWDPKSFIEFMRERLHLLGEGSANLAHFSTHSIKRGAVQLYRKIGMTDQWIMRRINMHGEYAYLRYTAEFNDVAPQEVPQFSNVDAATNWAQIRADDDLNLEDALGDEEDDHGVLVDAIVSIN